MVCSADTSTTNPSARRALLKLEVFLDSGSRIYHIGQFPFCFPLSQHTPYLGVSGDDEGP